MYSGWAWAEGTASGRGRSGRVQFWVYNLGASDQGFLRAVCSIITSLSQSYNPLNTFSSLCDTLSHQRSSAAPFPFLHQSSSLAQPREWPERQVNPFLFYLLLIHLDSCFGLDEH
jgi:hypothetical protein